MVTGKYIRLSRILNPKTRRLVVIPMDDGLLDGPEGGLRDMKEKVSQIVKGQVDAILGFKGILKNCYEQLQGTPVIMNLTASSSRSSHTRKTLVGSVEDALRYGADAVAVHVNVSSQYEHEMLGNLGLVSESCDKLGVPLLALMYPRGELSDGADDNYMTLKESCSEKYTELVRHAVRIGVEMGADIIKTHYTGSIDSFRTVIESAADIPVVIAGGPMLEDTDILRNAYGAIQAGGSGVCFGRNGFNRPNTTSFVRALRDIVHLEKTVEEAEAYLIS